MAHSLSLLGTALHLLCPADAHERVPHARRALRRLWAVYSRGHLGPTPAHAAPPVLAWAGADPILAAVLRCARVLEAVAPRQSWPADDLRALLAAGLRIARWHPREATFHLALQQLLFRKLLPGLAAQAPLQDCSDGVTPREPPLPVEWFPHDQRTMLLDCMANCFRAHRPILNLVWQCAVNLRLLLAQLPGLASVLVQHKSLVSGVVRCLAEDAQCPEVVEQLTLLLSALAANEAYGQSFLADLRQLPLATALRTVRLVNRGDEGLARAAERLEATLSLRPLRRRLRGVDKGEPRPSE